MLSEGRYKPEIFYVHYTDKVSDDWKINRKRLEKTGRVPFNHLNKTEKFPGILTDDIIIDAIFGTGLTRPAGGFAAEIISQINQTGCTIISIDIPSGLLERTIAIIFPAISLKQITRLVFSFQSFHFSLPIIMHM